MFITDAIEKMTIKAKLMALICLPIASVIILSIIQLVGENGEQNRAEKTSAMVSLAPQVSSLIHALALERGLSVKFLGSKNTSASEALVDQQQKTDKVWKGVAKNFNEAADAIDAPVFQQAQKQLVGALKSLKSERNEISERGISQKKVLSYYTRVNKKLLGVVRNLLEVSGADHQLSAYVALLHLSEISAIERALLADVFARGSFSAGRFTKFTSLVAEQRAYHDVFKFYADAESAADYKKEMQGKAIEDVKEMRRIAFSAIKKKEYTAELSKLLGYGGLIHQFKNLVLRGREGYRRAFLDQYKVFQEVVAKTEKLKSLSDADRKDLKVVSATLKRYRNDVTTVVNRRRGGVKIATVDRAVKIDDGPAIKAMSRLARGGSLGVDVDVWFASKRKQLSRLKSVEDKIAARVVSIADGDSSSAVISLIFQVIFIFLIVSLSVIASNLISADLGSAVTNLAARARKLNDAIASGELSQRIDVSSLPGEFNSIAVSMNTMIDILSDLVVKVQASAYRLSDKVEDLTIVSGKMLTGSSDLTGRSSGVASATEELSTNIGSIASAIEEMSVNISSVSSAAEEMSANMNAVAGSVEEMSSSIQDIATNAGKAQEVSSKAVDLSRQGQSSMDRLGKVASEIGKVTNVIKRIAEQTNLLALNATIEAASAGDAGKGFAVVANEIKELASQSAEATEVISRHVRGVQLNTGESVKIITSVTEIIENIGSAVSDITHSVNQQSVVAVQISDNITQANIGANEVANAISEVATGANDMSRNAGEAARGTTEVASNIGGVNIIASESNQGAEKLNDSAKELTELADELKEATVQYRIVA